MTVRVFDIPALKESIQHDALMRCLGLLSDVVETKLDDATVADVARFYISAYERWETSREWRSAVRVCRD